MGIQVNIRDVPVKVRDELASRAAAQGKSMQEFLRGELIRIAASPSIDRWLAELRKHKQATRSQVSIDQIVDAVHAERR